jgi:hypothetical protein
MLSIPIPEHVKKKAMMQLDIQERNAIKSLKIQEEHWINLPGTSNRPRLEFSSNSQLVDLYARRLIIEEIRDKVSLTSKARVENTSYNLPMVFVGDFFLYSCDHQDHLESYNVFLAVLDSLVGQLHAYMYAQILDCWHLRPIKVYQHIDTFIKTGLNLLFTIDDEFYKFAKSILSLSIGNILKNHDFLKNHVFLTSLLEDIPENIQGSDFIQFFVKARDEQTTLTIMEIAGLAKIFGHPVVDFKAGVVKLRKEAGEQRPEIIPNCPGIATYFKYIFSANYYAKHHTWPKCKLSENAHDCLVYNVTHQTWTTLHGVSLTSKMFEELQFEQTIDVNYDIDQTELLIDTAICGGLRDWTIEYDTDALRHIGVYKTATSDIETRTILKFLKSEEVDLRAIVKRMSEARWTDNERLIVLNAKERELNYQPRYFAKLCYEIRMWQVFTEMCIGKYILKYNSSQSMTMSEEELIKCQSMMTKEQGTNPKKLTHFLMSCDFKQWNAQMRLESTYHIFKCMDDLLGTGSSIANTHLYAQYCWFIVADKYTPPSVNGQDLAEGDMCWYRQEAFQDGMRQKGWTDMTQKLIVEASQKFGVSCRLLGQGDNQVILVKYPKDLPKRYNGDYLRYAFDYVAAVQANCDKVKIKMKANETWVAACLYEYNKRHCWKGAQVPCAFKKIARIHGDANEPFPTISEDISTAFGTCAAVCSDEHFQSAPYIMALIETQYILQNRHSVTKKWTENELFSTLIVGRTMGGFPITLYSNFKVRGMNDPVSCNISLYRFIEKNYFSTWMIICKMAWLQFRHQPDYFALIKDPVCLSLKVPQQPETSILDMLLIGLQSVCKNKFLTKIFGMNIEQEKDNLVSCLMNIRQISGNLSQINPRIANSLYHCSNYGLADAAMAKFQYAKSISKIIGEDSASHLSLLETITSAEDRLMKYYDAKMKNTTHRGTVKDALQLEGVSSNCSTTLARLVREKSWKFLIVGVTMPPVCEQIELIIPYLHSDRTILMYLDDASKNLNLMELLTQRGARPVYAGSSTEEKVKPAVFKLIGKTNFTSRIKRMSTLASWIWSLSSDEMRLFLTHMIKSKLESGQIILDEDNITALGPQVQSGSIYHRLHDSSTPQAAMINMTHNFSTHLIFTSSLATKFAKQKENHAIFWQLVYLASIDMLKDICYFIGVKNLRQPIGIKLTCEECTFPIPDEKFDYVGHQSIEIMSSLQEPVKCEINQCKLNDVMDWQIDRICTCSIMFKCSLFMAYTIANRIRTLEIKTRIGMQGQFDSNTRSFNTKGLSLGDLSRADAINLLGYTSFYLLCMNEPDNIQEEISMMNLLPGTVPYEMVYEFFIACGVIQEYIEEYELYIPRNISRDSSSQRILMRSILNHALCQFIERLKTDDKLVVFAPSNMTRYQFCQIWYYSLLLTNQLGKLHGVKTPSDLLGKVNNQLSHKFSQELIESSPMVVEIDYQDFRSKLGPTKWQKIKTVLVTELLAEEEIAQEIPWIRREFSDHGNDQVAKSTENLWAIETLSSNRSFILQLLYCVGSHGLISMGIDLISGVELTTAEEKCMATIGEESGDILAAWSSLFPNDYLYPIMNQMPGISNNYPETYTLSGLITVSKKIPMLITSGGLTEYYTDDGINHLHRVMTHCGSTDMTVVQYRCLLFWIPPSKRTFGNFIKLLDNLMSSYVFEKKSRLIIRVNMKTVVTYWLIESLKQSFSRVSIRLPLESLQEQTYAFIVCEQLFRFCLNEKTSISVSTTDCIEKVANDLNNSRSFVVDQVLRVIVRRMKRLKHYANYKKIVCNIPNYITSHLPVHSEVETLAVLMNRTLKFLCVGSHQFMIGQDNKLSFNDHKRRALYLQPRLIILMQLIILRAIFKKTRNFILTPKQFSTSFELCCHSDGFDFCSGSCSLKHYKFSLYYQLGSNLEIDRVIANELYLETHFNTVHIEDINCVPMRQFLENEVEKYPSRVI